MRSRRDGRATGESKEQVAVFLSVLAVESELQSKVTELIGSVDETFPEILYNETDQMGCDSSMWKVAVHGGTTPDKRI